MLVLSRKPGEKILIGDNVTVTIVRIGLNTVRIGIEAPDDMNIVREELVTLASDPVPHGPDARTRRPSCGSGESRAEDLGASVLARQLRGEHG